jgi:hypothetical protein
MKKPPIPPLPKDGESRTRFDQALKESVEIIKGDRGTRIEPLDEVTATTQQVAVKINEIIALLHGV